MLERKDIEKKYKWDLTVIYSDDAAFFADYKRAEELIKKFAAHEKTMTRSANDFYNTLLDYIKIEEIIDKQMSERISNSDYFLKFVDVKDVVFEEGLDVMSKM